LFAFLTAVGAIGPQSSVHHYVPAMAPAALSAGAVMSIVRGQPFTIAIAKRYTPPERWHEPRFYRANIWISTMWAISFLATAIALAVLLTTASHPATWVIVLEVLGFVVPMRCTAVYRSRLRAREAIPDTRPTNHACPAT